MSPAARPGPPLPQEALLVPLLDAAADVLRALDPGEIPASLKPLAGFDRRGLTRSAARSQLARALETEKAFRAKVVDEFVARDEVQAALDAWAPGDASKLIGDAAARDDLALVVSALFAGRPPGWEYGLGVATEAYERRRTDDDAEGDRVAAENRLAAAERARKRAEEARAAMANQLERAEAELKEERRARRSRDDEAGGEIDEARRQIDQLETALAEARSAIEAEQARAIAADTHVNEADRRVEEIVAAGRAADERRATADQRVKTLEERLAATEERLAAAGRRATELERALSERGAPPVSAPPGAGSSIPVRTYDADDLRELDKVARVAAELARHLDTLSQRVAHNAADALLAATALAATEVAVAAPDGGHEVVAGAVADVADGVADVLPSAAVDVVVDVEESDEESHEESDDVGDEPTLGLEIGEVTSQLEPARDLELGDGDEPLDAIPVQVPTTTRRGRRRAQVPVPPGMLDDSVEAADAMVRTPGLAIVVDGYNISMLAWPDSTLVQQRDRLCSALNELQLRVRCQVTAVFDGADVEGARPVRYPGLRVIFSKAGEEADAVVIQEVIARPLTVPVLVASSDGWVREHAEAEGARVLSAATLLKVLRR